MRLLTPCITGRGPPCTFDIIDNDFHPQKIKMMMENSNQEWRCISYYKSWFSSQPFLFWGRYDPRLMSILWMYPHSQLGVKSYRQNYTRNMLYVSLLPHRAVQCLLMSKGLQQGGGGEPAPTRNAYKNRQNMSAVFWGWVSWTMWHRWRTNLGV